MEIEQSRLEQTLRRIAGLDELAMQNAERQIDRLTKPPGSLGRLEEIARQIAGITGVLNPDLSRKAVVVMAGDHGVCEEGVSAFPAEVTPQMVLNFLNGGAAVNVLARHVGADVVCVDIGVNSDIGHPDLLVRKVGRGTGNIAVGPAMTREEAVQAIGIGIETVESLVDRGYRLFATGEMGIGNTTPSSALLTALTGADIESAVGRGTGIGDETLRRKRDVIGRALRVNRPDADDPLDVLAKVGGYEIAGLVGVILGAAANRCPVVVDGFISSVAALVASRIAPVAKGFMLPSHLSHERGHRLLMEHLGLRPILQMDMRLGEGTGAVMTFPIVEASMKLMNEMATFESAGVSGKETE
ncbi:nicotinate-nucleotide--dimethylbenzimidazole phosphoribosyltransferase [Paenibacillus ginsengarvi]|uniref:Nicotinate-nucleotide--dimethylbenzimidazole phosphoribosyltransferase n=1 Tax=Paenibacillus ginsengarvi TaxID=400777 RepID=A0A3B0BKB1_9BACL|nr:nicotinate-nucleotide--dimethylbenzimidazole phosphoribosyltransferase [Paenibacillus ginsengarvi]RKN72950.1 nicotinate-nucleotide--dimethylbenzimidazole phosphoribosyltransferase [Paenibacillus ginsengarvi]